MFESMIGLAEMLAIAQMGVVGDLKSDENSDIRDDISNIPPDNASNGFTYYVDSNAGDDGNDGLNWKEDGLGEGPFKTLTAAIVASNLTISTHPYLYGAGWAARNRIYYKGDSNTEAFTTMPDKCDVIGVGSGGGHRTMPSIIGEHLIVDTVIGCRFYNMGFVAAINAGNIFTLPSTCRGIEFHGCRFEGYVSGALIPGSAIVSESQYFLVIDDCDFVGRFADSVIEILSGVHVELVITNNRIQGGATDGIEIVTGVTFDTAYALPLIKDNFIDVSQICINDVDQTYARIINNTGVTAAARGLLLAGAVVGNPLLSAGNRFTCSDGANMLWPTPSVVWNETGGRNYYVESNGGSDANSGSSWDDALKTLTAALALSHANIALGNPTYDARNQIFYKGDGNAESLTTLAQKTDIIGVGSGGGHRTMPSIIGTHTIGGGAFIGCRFYNMGFSPTANTDDIFTLPATCRGIEFHGCRFDATTAAGSNEAGSAIVSVGQYYLVIDDCDFVGLYSDSVIEILSGGHIELVITNNRIQGGASDGIEIVTGVLFNTDYAMPLIEGNTIDVALITVNDVDVTYARILNNTLISAANEGSVALEGAVVGNVKISAGNTVSAGNTAANTPWPAVVAGS